MCSSWHHSSKKSKYESSLLIYYHVKFFRNTVPWGEFYGRGVTSADCICNLNDKMSMRLNPTHLNLLKKIEHCRFVGGLIWNCEPEVWCFFIPHVLTVVLGAERVRGRRGKGVEREDDRRRSTTGVTNLDGPSLDSSATNGPPPWPLRPTTTPSRIVCCGPVWEQKPKKMISVSPSFSL